MFSKLCEPRWGFGRTKYGKICRKKLRIVVGKRTQIGFKFILLLIKGFMPEWWGGPGGLCGWRRLDPSLHSSTLGSHFLYYFSLWNPIWNWQIRFPSIRQIYIPKTSFFRAWHNKHQVRRIIFRNPPHRLYQKDYQVQKVATEKWNNYTRRHKCQI